MEMDREQLEFLISQYVDGTLSAAEVTALEQTLASDAEARAMLEDFRRLDASLKRETALPAINWDRLSERLSNAVAAEDDRASRVYRIGAWWGRVAVAAVVLIAVGSVVLFHFHKPAKLEVVSGPTPPQPTGVVIAEISGPVVEAATQPAVAEITIAPSPLAQQLNYGVAETIVYQTPRVVIASSQFDRQDSPQFPY